MKLMIEDQIKIRFGIILGLVLILMSYLVWSIAFSGYDLIKYEENATNTTLEEIVSGKFITSLNKFGKNGTMVFVGNLTVLETERELDGDIHVHVTNGKLKVFVTEITPYWQLRGVTAPKIGSVIEEIGTPFCDTPHEDEVWHGNTCWEIHPVIRWNYSS